MNILIIGYGNIGKKHERNLNLLGYTAKKFDISISDCPSNYCVCTDPSKLNEKYDLVLICSPTQTHIDYIDYFLKMELDRRPKVIFVEKPLSNRPILERVDLLPFFPEDEQGNLLNTQIIVGYNYKFERGLIKLRENLNLVGEINLVTIENGYAYEKMHSYPFEKYEGILLDDIHVINTTKWLFGPPVEYLYSFIRPKIALIGWGLKNEAIVTISTDCVNQRYKKRIEVKGSEGNLVWNYGEHELFFCPKDETTRQAIPYQNADMHLEEMKYITQNIENHEIMNINDLEDAKEDLEIIECLKKISQ